MFGEVSWEIVPTNLRWRTDTVEPGTSVTGILAGPVVRVRTHWTGSENKPCLTTTTKGKMYCPCADRPMSGRTYGYVPLLTEQADKIVVPASALVGHLVEAIRPGTLIELARSKKPKAPLKLIVKDPAAQGAAWVKRMQKCCTHDIQEYLCHLWQIRALTEHFGFQFRPAMQKPTG